MDSGYILKVELIGCLDGLDLDDGERNKNSKGNSEMFYLNWVSGSIIYQTAKVRNLSVLKFLEIPFWKFKCHSSMSPHFHKLLLLK